MEYYSHRNKRGRMSTTLSLDSTNSLNGSRSVRFFTVTMLYWSTRKFLFTFLLRVSVGQKSNYINRYGLFKSRI